MAGEISGSGYFTEIDVESSYDPESERISFRESQYGAQIWPRLILSKDKVVWFYIIKSHLGQQVLFVDDLRGPVNWAGWVAAINAMHEEISSQAN